MSIEIESIKDIDVLQSLLNVNLQVKASWVELHVTYLNVQRNRLNPLTLDQKQKLWLPTLLFPSANDKPEILFRDDSANGEILINDR